MVARSAISGCIALAAILAFTSIGRTQNNEPVPLEYVRVCDLFGVGYFFSPGTETCIHASTGVTRDASDFTAPPGSTQIKSRIDAIEERLNGAFAGLSQELSEQASIAAALQDPDLVAGERFGIRMNWGNAGHANAFGFTGTAVLSDDVFGGKGRVAASGGVGFSGSTVGGRAGIQLTW